MSTLEATVVIQNQTIQNLRVEMDQMRKNYEGANMSQSCLEGSKQYWNSIQQMDSPLQKDLLESKMAMQLSDSTAKLQLTQSKRRLQPGSTEHNRRILQETFDCEQLCLHCKSCNCSHQDSRSIARKQQGRSYESKRPGQGRNKTSNDFAEGRRQGRSSESTDCRHKSAENLNSKTTF